MCIHSLTSFKSVYPAVPTRTYICRLEMNYNSVAQWSERSPRSREIAGSNPQPRYTKRVKMVQVVSLLQAVKMVQVVSLLQAVKMVQVVSLLQASRG